MCLCGDQVYVPPAARPPTNGSATTATVAALFLPWAVFGPSGQRWYREATAPVPLRFTTRAAMDVRFTSVPVVFGKVCVPWRANGYFRACWCVSMCVTVCV